MAIILTLIHVFACFILIGVVLLQSGKAADLAGAFGGMGSQTAFGPRGAATVLTKVTAIAAGVFMFTSLTLSIVATREQGSAATVLDKAKPAKKSEQKNAAPVPNNGMPQVEIFPEGDPSQGQKIPLPIDPSKKQTVTIPAQPAPPAQKK